MATLYDGPVTSLAAVNSAGAGFPDGVRWYWLTDHNGDDREGVTRG